MPRPSIYLFLVLFFYQQLLSSESISVTVPDYHIQAGQIFQVRIESNQNLSNLAYPLQLHAECSNNDQFLSQQKTPIKRWEDLNQGLDISFNLTEHKLAAAIALDVIISDASNKHIYKRRHLIKTTQSLKQQFNTFVAQWRSSAVTNNKKALQQLRLEQAAMILRKPMRIADSAHIESYFAELNEIEKPLEAIRAWPQLVESAFLHELDQSAQLLRLFMPNKTPRGLLICFRSYEAVPSKINWPPLPPAYISWAKQQQLALLDVYPSGDRQCDGVYALRAQDALNQAAEVQAELAHVPRLVLSEGIASRAALQYACLNQTKTLHGILCIDADPTINISPEQAQRLAHVPIGLSGGLMPWLKTIQAQRSGDSPELLTRVGLGSIAQGKAWQWLSDQTQHQGAAFVQQQKLHQFGERPIVCIQGSGEHLQAKQYINDLRQSIMAAWAQHCQARLPLVNDHEFRPDQYAGHDLIFLGNPFDNSALAALLAQSDGKATLNWDEREISHPNGRCLRSQVLQLQWHFSHKQRHIFVLDGPALRFPIGPLPLNPPQSQLILRQEGRVWAAD